MEKRIFMLGQVRQVWLQLNNTMLPIKSVGSYACGGKSVKLIWAEEPDLFIQSIVVEAGFVNRITLVEHVWCDGVKPYTCAIFEVFSRSAGANPTLCADDCFEFSFVDVF